MRRTWWHLRFMKDDDGQDVFVHGGRAFRAVTRAAARIGRGWKLAHGPVRVHRMDIAVES